MDGRVTVEEMAAKLAPREGWNGDRYVLPEEVLIWRLGYEAAIWKAIAMKALHRG